MIKFSKVKPGEFFTFCFYDKNFGDNKDFIWVFFKKSLTDFVAVKTPLDKNAKFGQEWTYDADDDTMCVVLDFDYIG